MALVIDQFICRTDNFAVLVHDEASGRTLAIDAPDPAPIEARLRERGWGLDLILVTHRHGDHTAGNLALKAAFGSSVIGPAAEAADIPGIDRSVAAGDRIDFGDHVFEVIETPGHSPGHVAYWSPDDRLAFVGDTLFSLGCGRVEEAQLGTQFRSLEKLAALPRDTAVYCGHEYTVANGRFAVTIEPNNIDLAARVEEAAALREQGRPTLPTTIGQELATNPFLRSGKRRLRMATGMKDAEPAEIFAILRRRKDTFR